MHVTTRLTSLAAAVLLVSGTVLLSGCGGYGPEKTVTIKISGAADEAQRDEIQEKLKTMTDGSGHSMSSSYSGATMTIELAPVSDVEAFSKKIDFGEVTSVDGRTVEVEVGGGEGDSPDAE